jgi:alpha-N-arabinofuranosidase
VLTKNVRRDLDAISHHYYTIPGKEWRKKGNSTGFPEAEWISTLAHTMRIDEYITQNEKILEERDPQNRTAFYVDEWGTWYDPEPGREPGFLYQQNTLRDALVAALNINIFTKHADRMKMANIAQMVNVLQAMILTKEEKMVLTPTYHVFEMFKAYQDAAVLAIDLKSPWYNRDASTMPAVSASAVRGKDGRVHIGLVNVDPNRAVAITAKLSGSTGASVTGRVLTAPAINSHNTFEQTTTVKPAAFSGATVESGVLKAMLPPKSVVVLDLQ